MKIFFYETTHQGARQNNQDYYAHLITDNGSLFIVADGLGGCQKGEVAATEFCQACIAYAKDYALQIQEDPLEGMPDFIAYCAKVMCEHIRQKYGRLNTQTVFALVWITEKNVITAHIGDARVYRLSENECWRTPDHSVVQQLFEQHQIEEVDFGTHPLQNKLLNAVNTYETPMPEIFLQPPLGQDETLLLCSDGFWGRLSKQDLRVMATSKDLEATIQGKITEILDEFGTISDNITVQAVRIQ